MDAFQFLLFAEGLLKQPAHQASCRSAISRAYYAAHHLIKEFVESAGIGLEKSGNAHADVWNHLAAVGDAEIEQVGNDLRNLHSERINADYRLAKKHVEEVKTASSLVAQARELIETVRQCRTDLARYDNLKKGIRTRHSILSGGSVGHSPPGHPPEKTQAKEAATLPDAPIYLIYLADAEGDTATFAVFTHYLRRQDDGREVRTPSLISREKVRTALDVLDRPVQVIADRDRLERWLNGRSGWAAFRPEAALLVPHWLGEGIEYVCTHFRLRSLADMDFVESSCLGDLATSSVRFDLIGPSPDNKAFEWFMQITGNLVFSKRPITIGGPVS